MQRIKIFLLSIITLIMIFSCLGCNQLYKAGNVVSLDYPIETPLRSSLIQAYCDTLIKKRGYNVPEKWLHENKLVELDSINHKRIYFKKDPEEMYLISFGGMLVLNDVYNPQIRSGDWVAHRELLPKKQEERVLERFRKEILDTIETMAKRDNLPDSIIYRE
jgi:hypothetical protein